jgi:type IV pilus assembly protein PilB
VADLEKITKKRLGEILVSEGVISQEQVQDALRIQEKTGDMLGEALVKAGYTTETEIAKTLCTQFAKPFIKPSKYDVARDVLGLLPSRLLIEQSFIPIDKFGNVLIIAMAGLLDAQTIAQIQKLTSCEVEIYIATTSDVKQTLRSSFPDQFDPITLLPKFESTANVALQKTSAIGQPSNGRGPAESQEMGSTTKEVMGLAEEESDWEALFEEAEQNVMRELKEKKGPSK